MAGIHERFLYLKSQTLLVEQMDDRTLRLMARHSRLRHFEAGQPVCGPRDPRGDLVVLLRGQVALRQNDRTLRLVLPHEPVAGPVDPLAEPTQPEALALTEADTLEIPRKVIVQAIEANPSLLRGTLMRLAQRLIELADGPQIHQEALPEGLPLAGPKTFAQRALMLSRMGLMADIHFDVLADLCRDTQAFQGAAGDTLIRPGQEPRSILLLEEGSFTCLWRGRSLTLGPGWSTGILNLLADMPFDFELRAESPFTASLLRRSTFLGLLELHPDFARAVQSALARRYMDARRRGAQGAEVQP